VNLTEKKALLKLIRRAENALSVAPNCEFDLEDTIANRELVLAMRDSIHPKGHDPRTVLADEDGKIWTIDWMLLHHLANKLEVELEE
jgi:hypothetical protein